MIALKVYNVEFDTDGKETGELLSSCEIVIDEEMMEDYLEDSNALLCKLLEEHSGFCVLNYEFEEIDDYDFNA
jgi:hypothetical protein